jgi:hypothetical protein
MPWNTRSGPGTHSPSATRPGRGRVRCLPGKKPAPSHMCRPGATTYVSGRFTRSGRAAGGTSSQLGTALPPPSVPAMPIAMADGVLSPALKAVTRRSEPFGVARWSNSEDTTSISGWTTSSVIATASTSSWAPRPGQYREGETQVKLEAAAGSP